ncbi:MAG: dihydrolipoamide acetyltransferase family protein [Anaerolineales bacterium]|jgi:pyruvate dehydrogenase E2 component (dihydrolipoamide acetyltransferase)
MAEIVEMPKLGFDMAEGTLVRWVIGEGDQVNKGDVLAEIETDKATVEVEANYSGVVRRHLVEEDTTVPVGEPIAVVGEEGEEIDWDALLAEAAPEAAPEEEKVAVEEKAEAKPVERREEERPPEEEGEAHLPEGVRASPLARRMSEEEGIDLGKVPGSGPQGRIVKADIEAYLEAKPVPEEGVPATAAAAPAAPTLAVEPGETKHIPRSRLRATIGRRMARSFQTAPHFYVTHEYDMAALMALRGQINASLPEGEKISVNDFIVKAVALALREFPNLNAALDEENDEVLHFGDINIGVAVAVENGLLTVVCRNTDFKPLRQIAGELKTMAARAREGRVRPADIEGSTFSVSNLGMFEVEHFTAIINPPEAAILAVGSVQDVPVVEEGEIRPGKRMKVTISIDHRVSDGAEAARFLQALAKYLQDPLLILV